MSALELRVRRPLREIPEADYGRLSSEALAVRYCTEQSGLQDKSVAIEVGVDNATLSRAKLGQARLSDEALHALMDATGLEAPLFAMLLRRGYDPRSLQRLESEQDRLLRERDERIAELEREREYTLRLLRDVRAVA